MTFIKGIQRSPPLKFQSRLVYVLYRDGLGYFVIIACELKWILMINWQFFLLWFHAKSSGKIIQSDRMVVRTRTPPTCWTTLKTNIRSFSHRSPIFPLQYSTSHTLIILSTLSVIEGWTLMPFTLLQLSFEWAAVTLLATRMFLNLRLAMYDTDWSGNALPTLNFADPSATATSSNGVEDWNRGMENQCRSATRVELSSMNASGCPWE